MPGFSKVCQNSLSFQEKSETEILELDQAVRQMYMTVPDVMRTRPMSDSIGDAPFLIMVRVYIEFIHLKSLLVLHRKYMARGNIFSMDTCIEAGSRLVSQFIEMYKEFSPGGQLHGERWMLSSFTLNDFLLGVMVLCLVLYTRRKHGIQHSASGATIDIDISKLLEQSHAICIEKSQASRDARRVSHAIRITLDGNKVPISVEAAVVSPIPSWFAAFSDVRSRNAAMRGDDAAMLPSVYGEEAAFGPFDPFNFMGNDLQGLDWSIPNEQWWDQSVSIENQFPTE
jgi:hypothetical protein